MSGLRQASEDYLAVRRALGFKLERHGQLLADFIGYLERAGADRITMELALAWARQPAGRDPVWWASRLSVARVFARHLASLDPATEVPPPDVLPTGGRRRTPHLFSPADVAGLMAAARALRSPLRAATHETLIGLLVVTGLRIGEAMRMCRADVDLDEGLLTVVHSKFGKSREVPLHPSTVDALRAYARRRDQLCPRPKAPNFFVSTAGTALRYNEVRTTFCGLARQAGLDRGAGLPRLHQLRHGFAVATVVDWYRRGADVEALLPRLSTFLGHVQPRSTYWYLQAAPELLGLAAQRLERALPGLS